MVPISAAGVYAHGSLKKNDMVLMDVGAGAIVEKTIDDSLAMVGSRIEEIQKRLEKDQQAFLVMQSEHNKLAQKLEKELPRNQ